jgi:hypothetical protein
MSVEKRVTRQEVTFSLGGDVVIVATVQDGRLRLQGDEPLWIAPMASNVVLVGPVRKRS